MVVDEAVWKLLHQEQPADGDECYLGFKERDGDVFVRRCVWRFSFGDWVDSTGRGVFGCIQPVYLPADIYWCESSKFFSVFEAAESLGSILPQSCDRP